MEESEKRKERLKAMRMEAAQAESSDLAGISTVSSHLVNPLVEAPRPSSLREEWHASPRFDYYTDPMSAFCGNKACADAGFRSPQVNFKPPNCASQVTHGMPHFSGPRNTEESPSPAHRWQINDPPQNSVYQAEGPRHRFTQQSLMGISHPFQMHTSPQTWNQSSYARGYLSLSGASGATPYSDKRQGHFHWRGNSPRSALGPGQSSAVSNRVRGQWSEGSPRSGRSSGRGVGFHGHGSAKGRPTGPERFFSDSMLEDPWKDLRPITWKGVDFPLVGSSSLGPSSNWMPESIRPKKPRVAGSPIKSGSGLNLAEYLAASFNEAVSEKPSP